MNRTEVVLQTRTVYVLPTVTGTALDINLAAGTIINLNRKATAIGETMDIFDFAIKMKTDAEAYYQKLAEQSDIEGIRDIFLDLAADEKTHFEIFNSMKERSDIATMRDSEAQTNAKNAFDLHRKVTMQVRGSNRIVQLKTVFSRYARASLALYLATTSHLLTTSS